MRAAARPRDWHLGDFPRGEFPNFPNKEAEWQQTLSN